VIGFLYALADRLRRRRYPENHGRIGEDLAHRFLRRQGCTVSARNYRPPSGSGEIDLVAWHCGQLVFVEVKTRATAEFGAPDSAVDAEKRTRLFWAAEAYARRAGVPWEKTRFDIVGIILSKKPVIEWQRDAFRPQTRLK
jgi:putative endonuclease